MNTSQGRSTYSIGTEHAGRILVCSGEIALSYIDWLEPLAQEVDHLVELSSTYGIELKPSQDLSPITNTVEFLQLSGVWIDSHFIEHDHTSEIYHEGWIKKKDLERIKKETALLVERIRCSFDQTVRSAVIKSLLDIKDTQEFLERTNEDPRALFKTIASQKITIQDLIQKKDAVEVAVAYAADTKVAEFRLGLLKLVACLVHGGGMPVITGPFIFWTDQNLYVLEQVGSSSMPFATELVTVLEIAAHCNRTIIRVRERTVVGRWLSGQKYRSLGIGVSDWMEAWYASPNLKRVFETTPVEFESVVPSIIEAITEGSLL